MTRLATTQSWKFLLASVAICTAVLASPATSQSKGAEPLDAASEAALHQTQQAMTDPAARAKMIQSDPSAKAHDAKVQSLLGNRTDDAYKISSEITATLVRQANGDPKKMQELVNQLMSNPQALEQYLTPEQRNQIRNMASEVERKNGAPHASGAGH